MQVLKSDRLTNYLVYVLMIIFIMGPLFQGLFYPIQYLVAYLILTIITLIVVLTSKDLPDFLSSQMPKLLAIFIFIYGLAAIGAANKSVAILEFYKVIPALYMLFLGFTLTRNKKEVQIVKAIVLGGALTGVLGLITFLNDSLLPGAVLSGRMQSSFQYANTFALYMLICYLFGLTLWTGSNKIEKVFLASSYFLFLIGLTLSFSRGVWLLYPIILGFLFLEMPKQKRKEIAKPVFFSNLVLGGAALIYTSLFNPKIFQRITEISLNAKEFQGRVAHFIDAVAIIADRPLLGLGGGNWAASQFQYQTSDYYLKVIHNYFLQIAVDAGVGALGLFLVILVAFFLKTMQVKSSSQFNFSLIIYRTVVFALILHSLVDLDFNFPIVAYIFWFLIGASMANSNKGELTFASKLGKSGKIRGIKIIASGLFLLLAFISLGLLQGEISTTKGKSALARKSFTEAEHYFTEASSYNPMNPESYSGLGEIYEQVGVKEKDPVILDQALKSYLKARELDSNNPKYLQQVAYLLFRTQRFTESASAFEQLIALNPLKMNHYENLALSLLLAGEESIEQPKKAKSFFEKVLVVPKLVEQAERKLSGWDYLAKHRPKQELKITPKLHESVSTAENHLKGL